MIRNALTALGSSHDGAESLVDDKTVCKSKKAKLEALLKATEDRLSDAWHRVQELELSKDTVD